MAKNQEEPHIGHKLKQVIEAKGVTNADVARYFGVTPPTVSSDWLKHGRIAKKHYQKLVEFSGLPYEWWFGKASADPQIDAVVLRMLKMSRSEKAALVKLAGTRKKAD